MDDDSAAEFDEDFGSSLHPPDLERLLARARATGARELRLLVRSSTGTPRIDTASTE